MSGVYLNDISAELAMRAAFKLNLLRIQKASGYHNDLLYVVFDPPVPPAQLPGYPAVVMVFGEERNTAESIDYMELTVPVILYCHVRDAESPATATALLKQDIQSVLGKFYALPDETGTPTCSRAKYVSALPFAKVNGLPASGVRIAVDVTYQQLTLDPTQN